MPDHPHLPGLQAALTGSPLAQGLQMLGDRWTLAVLMGAFTGVRRFNDWQSRLAIPRSTLADRLQRLTHLGLLRQRPGSDHPGRQAYHLTRAGLALYDPVLMSWLWEKRWSPRAQELPQRLQHRCGEGFTPRLVCSHCTRSVGLADLGYTLRPPPHAVHRPSAAGRSARWRATPRQRQELALGLKVDRWALLVVNAVVLGCRHFDQLTEALGIASGVLSRRLRGMVEARLLDAQVDASDGRRQIYRLTPASRDLTAYLVCLAHWAGRYLKQQDSIQAWHRTCGQPLVPRVVCNACAAPLLPWDVTFSPVPNANKDTP